MNPVRTIVSSTFDAVQINAPWGASLAVVKLADLKDLAAIVSMIIGTICTILVTHHKLKKGKRDE